MFDPLHKWLGIPPDQQPPDLYRLLGITPFESDEDVIHAAADKQLAFLHNLTNGAQAAAAEELSNQVSAARVTLVNKQKKAAYDSQLKRIMANQPAGAPGSAALRPPPLPGSDEAAVADRSPPPVISQCCSANPMIADSPKPPLVVVSQPRRPARHYRWQAVVRHVFSFIVFFLVPSVLIYQNPRVRQLVNGAMGNNEVRKSVTVIREPIPAQARVVTQDDAEAKVVQTDSAPILERSETSFLSQQPRPESAPQAKPEIAEPPAEKFVHLKLDLQSTRWIMPLEDTIESGKYFVTTVTDSPGTIELHPSSGELSTDQATRLAFDGTSGLVIDLRLEAVGKPPVLSVTGQWSWQIGSKSDLKFSLDRLERKAKDVYKECTGAANMIGALELRRKQLGLQVKSAYNTPIRIVRGWEKEIEAINGRMKELKPQAEYQKKSWEQFQMLMERVQQIHDRCELVVRNVDQP